MCPSLYDTKVTGPSSGIPTTATLYQSPPSAPSEMVDLNEKALKKERPEARPDNSGLPPSSVHGAGFQPSPNPPAVQKRTSRAPSSTGDLAQYIPSVSYLLWFLGGIFFCLAFQKFWQPTPTTHDAVVTFQPRFPEGGNKTNASFL